MKDADLRGIVLQTFYEKRRDPQFLPKPQMFSADMTQADVFHICEQLGQNGLLEWKANRTFDGGIGVGFGKITARGIDVVEGEAFPALQVHFMNQTVNISGSSNVIVGDGNQQEIANHIHALSAAIDSASGTPEQKAEAKGLLARFAGHPLVSAVVGGIISASQAGSGIN